MFITEISSKITENDNSSQALSENNNQSQTVLHSSVNQSQPVLNSFNGRNRSTDSQSRSSIDSLDSVESTSSQKSNSGGAPVATPRGKVGIIPFTFPEIQE